MRRYLLVCLFCMNGSYNFTTKYDYDLLGRMIQIIYPDSEVVNYEYRYEDLKSITGERDGEKTRYVTSFAYNADKQMMEMTYAYGYTTTYAYDIERQWLKNVSTSKIFTSIGRRSILRNASYEYDGVGNITRVEESTDAWQLNGITNFKSSTMRAYAYDAVNRLIGSTGQKVQGSETLNMQIPVYDYAISYSPSGMITSKTTTLNGVKTDLRYGYNVSLLRGQGGGTGFEGVSPSLTGGEDGSSAQTTWGVGVSPSTDAVRNHQIKTIASEEDTTELTWDADGQLTQMQRCRGVGNGDGSVTPPASNNDGEATVLSTRTHLWNENGQLAMFLSDDQAGYYGYDGNGERVYKLTGYVHKESYNAGDEMTKVMLNDVVLYVNPYFIVTPKGYTKHYYNGSQRLASVVGDISALPDSIVANASERLDNKLTEEYLQTFTNTDTLINVSVDYEPNMLLPILSKEKSDSVENYILAENTYYYHADHLGSMSWITDGNGDLVEHIRYLPYGEEWYHKKFNESDYTERYKFTGKERDGESGYNYFGARYYDSRLLTGWLSVDRLWWKHQNESPYLMCGGNPVKNYDPDGNEKYNFMHPTLKTDAVTHAAVNNYKDNKAAIHVWAHGSTNSMKFYTGNSNNAIQRKVGVDEVLGFLQENVFNKSEAWQKHETEGTQAVLVLHSCHTGEGENSLAQQLSEKLDNTVVVAPNTTIVTGKRTDNGQEVEAGAFSVEKTTNSRGGTNLKLGDVGQWRVFKNGKEIKTNPLSGSTKPNVEPNTY